MGGAPGEPLREPDGAGAGDRAPDGRWVVQFRYRYAVEEYGTEPYVFTGTRGELRTRTEAAFGRDFDVTSVITLEEWFQQARSVEER